jgi:membrane protein DedA with SNARE-associated domain
MSETKLTKFEKFTLIGFACWFSIIEILGGLSWIGVIPDITIDGGLSFRYMSVILTIGLLMIGGIVLYFYWRPLAFNVDDVTKGEKEQ